MYSKYKTERENLQYGRLQRDGNRFNNVSGMKFTNYESFRPTKNFNIGDNTNVLKLSKRFHDELGIFGKFSDEKDEEMDLFSIHPSTYDSHEHSYHDHYYSNANEYQQAQQDHQYHQHHQHRHNHNDHNHYHQNSKKSAYEDGYDMHVIPPLSVQPTFINKRNFNFDNNNSNLQNDGDRYVGEHRQTLPATECLQIQHANQINLDAVSEEHYQHYYSYFYNRHSRSPKVLIKPARGRKLPTTTKMPFSKTNINSNQSQLIPKYDVISAEENNSKADNNDNTLNSSMNYRQYVLKEKSANNNNEASYDNGNWHHEPDEKLKCAGGDYFNVNSYETFEQRTPNFSEAQKDTSLYPLGQQRNKRKLRINSADMSGKDISENNFAGREIIDVEENINAINTFEYMKKTQKNKLVTDNEESFHQNIKLQSSPAKLKGTTVKKLSPSPKTRRVLIYNIQSPRMSRLSTSNIKLQRSKLNFNVDNVEVKNKLTDDLPSEHKVHENQVRVLNSMFPVKNLNKNEVDVNKRKSINKIEDILKGSDNSDDDDDFDDVSDFDTTSDSDISSDSEEGYRSYAYKLTHSLDAASATPSVDSSIISESDSLDNPDTLLVPSLFPNVPPYLAFSSSTKKGPDVPADLYRILKWRVTNVMPRVVRSILANSGMRLLKKTNDWMGVWGKHMKSPCFKTIRPYQKINHLPGSFKIGRKDSCWKNLVKLMTKHGKKDFGFMPKTYIIPNDLKQLRKNWPKYAQKNVKWIIKPPASARGTGIRVVDRWAQIPKRKPLIVQKYIERPLLINGSKFDLRLYVLVTSINPLRVYMYHNGLARFASVKYSDKSDTLNDRCMHLTNYSINKFSSNYSKNEDVNACHGHKWTIKSLWSYLASRGVRTELLWAALRSLVLRTILSGENSINNMIRANVESKYSCFELFGFDVLLDADLVPWLLEVNISPSLHSELPLDCHVKAPLVQSVLNTALYNIPPKIPIERQKEIAMEMSLPPGPICYDKRMYINYLSRSEKIKHNTFTRKNMEDREEYTDAILDHLTPDDVRCLVIAEDELARCSPLERIFPTIDTYKYLKYTEAPRYYNRLLDAWETRYANNRIEGIHLLRQYCEDGYHLQIPQIPTKKPLKYRTRAIMKKRICRSALTISATSNKWRNLRRKIQIASINRVISLNSKLTGPHSVHNLSEEGELEEET